jgi:hypothetical protein
MQRLENIATSIGYICIYWAWLDDFLSEMIRKICPFDPRKMIASDLEQLDQIFRSHGDLRDKIKILRAVAFVRKWDPKWFQKLNTLLDRIDNDLRVKRNRMVHDCWFAPKRRLQRRTRQIKFKRPQSFALELSTAEHVPVRPSEVAALSRAILDALIKLVGLAVEFEDHQKLVDEAIQERVTEEWAKLISGLLAPSQEKSAQPNPPQAPTTSPKRSARSRRRSPPKSSAE